MSRTRRSSKSRRRKRVRKIRPRKRSLEEKKAFAEILKKRATPAEKALWKVLKHYTGWSFQEVVYGYIPDFYYKPGKLVVEVDGGVHRKQKLKDSIRTMHLEFRGCKVVRFTNSQVLHNLDGVLKQLHSLVGIPPFRSN